MQGAPPELPDEGYSDAAKDFVNSCMNKNPSLRPSYDRLLRHPWIADLMAPPSSEQGKTSQANCDLRSQSSDQVITPDYPLRPATEVVDEEVADWVRGCLDRLIGDGRIKKRPALHAAPLDAVPGSPLLEDPSHMFPK